MKSFATRLPRCRSWSAAFAVLLAVELPIQTIRADTTLNSGTTTVSTGTDFGANLYVGTTGTATLTVVAGGSATAATTYLGSTATGNGTARDLTAQSTNGAVAHLHVTGFTGLTSNDITIEDSSTGSSGWAVIGTFTQVTGLTSQRLAITGTVKQYVRVVDTAVGTGSCTRTVAFARR